MTTETLSQADLARLTSEQMMTYERSKKAGADWRPPWKVTAGWQFAALERRRRVASGRTMTDAEFSEIMRRHDNPRTHRRPA